MSLILRFCISLQILGFIGQIQCAYQENFWEKHVPKVIELPSIQQTFWIGDAQDDTVLTKYQAITNFYEHWAQNCSVDENKIKTRLHSMTFCSNDSQCNGMRICTKYGDCHGDSKCNNKDWKFISNGIYVNGIASNEQLQEISLNQINSCEGQEDLQSNQFDAPKQSAEQVPTEGWTITKDWELLDQYHQLQEGECLNSIKVWKDQYIESIEFGSNFNKTYSIGSEAAKLQKEFYSFKLQEDDCLLGLSTKRKDSKIAQIQFFHSYFYHVDNTVACLSTMNKGVMSLNSIFSTIIVCMFVVGWIFYYINRRYKCFAPTTDKNYQQVQISELSHQK